MSKLMILLILASLNIANTKLYTPFTPLSLSKNIVSKFYEFGLDLIIQSTNKTLMIGLSYQRDESQVIKFIHIAYMLITSRQQKNIGKQVVQIQEEIDGFTMVYWLDPDKLILFVDCQNILGVKVQIDNLHSNSYYLQFPSTLACIQQQTYTDWSNYKQSNFYVVGKMKGQQNDESEDRMMKLSLSNNFTLSIIGQSEIFSYTFLLYFRKILDYYCKCQFQDSSLELDCYNFQNESYNSRVTGKVEVLSQEIIVQLQILSEKIAIVTIYIQDNQEKYFLQNLIYYYEIREEKIEFIRGKKLNFQIVFQQVDFGISQMLQSNTLALIYYNIKNKKYQIYLYGCYEQTVQFYQYAQLQGYLDSDHSEIQNFLFFQDFIIIPIQNDVYQMALNSPSHQLPTMTIAIIVLVSVFFIILSIPLLLEPIFLRSKFMITIRKTTTIIRLILISLLYATVILRVIQTNTNIIGFTTFTQIFYSIQQSSNNYLPVEGNKTIGSEFLELFNQVFLFQLIILIMFEMKDEMLYGITDLQFHMKHGLSHFTYFSHRITNVSIKSLFYSITLTIFIHQLQHLYCDPFYSIFTLDWNIITCILITYMDFVSSLVIGIIFVHFSQNVLSTIGIYILIIFGLQYYSSFLNGTVKITNNQYLMSAVFPSMSTPAFLESMHGVNIHYVSQKLQPSVILVFSAIKYLLFIFLYFASLRRKKNQKKFEELIQKQSNNQKESILTYKTQIESKNQSVSSIEILQQDLEEQRQKQPMLSVFIPQKMNLKNRLEKNKVLSNIRFTANIGQIISFIDTQHESKKALMKILINDEKSDAVINTQLLGFVTYRQKLQLSFCYEKDIYFPELTIKQHLSFFFSLKKPRAKRAQREAQILRIMDEFNIPEEYHNKKSKNLSGGYLKKMCLACTFIGNPALVILQEPTVGLDLRFQRIFWNKLKLWRENKLIIVFTSNSSEAETISDKIWHFQKAKIYDFFELKNRSKRMDLTFEFMNNQSYLEGKKIISRYVNRTKDICREILKSSISFPSICITSFRINEEASVSSLLQLLKEIKELNSQLFNYHFRLQIRDCLIQPEQIIKQFKNYPCNFCDRQKILQFLQETEDPPTAQPQLVYQSEESLMSATQKIQQSIFPQLPSANELNNRSLWFSQISSVIIRRWFLYSRNNLKQKILIPQAIILLYGFIIFEAESSGNNLNIQFSEQFIVKIGLYFLLHSFVFDYFRSQSKEKHLKYYQSIGLNINSYWIGTFIIETAITFIPLAISLILIASLLWFQEYQSKIQLISEIGFSLLYTIGHTLFSMNLGLFTNNQSIFIAILTLIVIFPVNLSTNTYLNYYEWSSQTVIDFFPYFLYPWSIKKAFSQDGETMALISLAIQFVTLSLFLFFFETLKRIFAKKQTKLYFQQSQNVINAYIDDERQFIENIIDQRQYIKGENLIKVYGKSFALRNVYFHVKLGQMLGIFGHNSSGKTSLFNIIVDRLSLTSGRIKYFGKEKYQFSWRDKLNLGYCPQIDNLDDNLTYQQNVRVIGRIKGLSNDQINKHIKVLGKYLNFEGNQQVRLCDLSINERKKSNFIIALLGLPQIFMMDQISTGVDESCSHLFLALLKAYASQLKKAVILTSHNVLQGENYCDRVMILKNGVIKSAGTPFELKMGAAFQLYKVIVSFSRKESPVVRGKKKQKVKLLVEKYQFKKIVFQEQYRVCYGFDMYRSKISQILQQFINLYGDGTVYQLSFYKYDLQEVAKYYMIQDQKQI